MASLLVRRTLRLAPLPALLLVANARAEPFIRHPVRLEYELGPGTETCADEAAVRHAILTSAIDTKEDPFSPTAKALLRVVIVRVGPRFKASYELRDDAGKLVMERQLPEHVTCANAVVSVGLSVGLFMLGAWIAPSPGPSASEEGVAQKIAGAVTAASLTPRASDAPAPAESSAAPLPAFSAKSAAGPSSGASKGSSLSPGAALPEAYSDPLGDRSGRGARGPGVAQEGLSTRAAPRRA